MTTRGWSRVMAALVATAWIAGCTVADRAPSGQADAPSVRRELERIEDLRILHHYAIGELHDARALAIYLKGWAGPDRYAEVETLMVEGAGLHGWLRGVDLGATGMQAQLDTPDAPPVSAARLDLVQRARGDVARRVNDFYRRSAALKAQLTEQVKAQATAAKATWQVTSQPEPWPDPLREAGRQAGLRFGWRVHDDFFDLPEAEADYYLAKGRKMGFTFGNVTWPAACNWGDIEREPGKYDFAALDKMFAQFARNGMTPAPMLRTLTGTPPRWHLDKYRADCRFTVPVWDRKQRKNVPTQQGINLLHAPTGEAATRFLTAYAVHLKAKWAVRIEGVYIEGSQRELEAPQDTSKAMDAFWRAWSKTDTPWRTPEQIRADEKPDEAAAVRAEMCREAWLIEYVRRVRAALKLGWPELRVQSETASDDFHRLFAARTGRSRVLPELCALADNPSTRTDSPAGFALVRSFAPGRWLWHLDIHSGCGITASAANAQTPFYDVVRIVSGTYDNCLRAHFPHAWFRYCDGQIGGFGIGSYYLSPRRSQQLSPVILNTETAPAQVAVLWSQSSLRRDVAREWFKSVMSWGHMLKRADVHFDYVSEADLAERVKDYKVLVLPNAQSLPLDVCNTIRDWVKGGGVLMGFGAPGLYDEHGARRAALPLADVFGADVARLRTSTAVRPDNLFTGHPEGAYQHPAPRPYKFNANLTAVLKPNGGAVRAWFASAEEEPAIVESTFGEGKAMLCGFPLGYEYWESAPYEVAYGLTHSRQNNYNEEQKRYEQWIVKELEKRGVVRQVVVPRGWMLRAQRGDDPDWFHVARNGPKYREYMYEADRPARTVYGFLRKRDGINNAYVGLSHTEGNYFWERGYFRCTLAGGEVTAAVAADAPPAGSPRLPLVFDARLGVPVPGRFQGGRVTFTTWLPAARSAAFAISPDGNVRLFGEAHLTGEGPQAVAARTAQYETAAGLAKVEVLEADAVAAFLEARRGKDLVIGCGDIRFQPVGEKLAAWLKASYAINASLSMAGPRASCRYAYQDGFGYTRFGADPVHADILIGNCQDNGLMQKFITPQDWVGWLPLEVNQEFPGLGRAVVMLSVPVVTQANGRPGGKVAGQQLIIGAGFPAEAMKAVDVLRWKLK